MNLNEYIVKIFIILKNILPNKFLSQPIKEALFLLSYELIRMNFYWMQVINCNIKSQHGIHNGWLTNLLTQLKGAQFWFKFDYLDFISKFDIAREYRDIIINVLTKLLEMRSESEKFWENISSLNNSIFFVNDNLKQDEINKLYTYFKPATEFINKELKKNSIILVHCYAGRQRSASIIASYLMKYAKMNLKEAIISIRSKRPISFIPSANFKKVLLKYEKKLSQL